MIYLTRFSLSPSFFNLYCFKSEYCISMLASKNPSTPSNIPNLNIYFCINLNPGSRRNLIKLNFLPLFLLSIALNVEYLFVLSIYCSKESKL